MNLIIIVMYSSKVFLIITAYEEVTGFRYVFRVNVPLIWQLIKVLHKLLLQEGQGIWFAVV